MLFLYLYELQMKAESLSCGCQGGLSNLSENWVQSVYRILTVILAS